MPQRHGREMCAGASASERSLWARALRPMPPSKRPARQPTTEPATPILLPPRPHTRPNPSPNPPQPTSPQPRPAVAPPESAAAADDNDDDDPQRHQANGAGGATAAAPGAATAHGSAATASGSAATAPRSRVLCVGCEGGSLGVWRLRGAGHSVAWACGRVALAGEGVPPPARSGFGTALTGGQGGAGALWGVAWGGLRGGL